MKKRLDTILFEQKYFPSTSKAQSAILSGSVIINNKKEDKPGKHFHPEEIKNIIIKEKDKYVSRGGYKLEKAIQKFNVDVNNKICLDIGCSTGGFTDCLLQFGACKVYSIDVGYGQFDYKLRQDPRVILIEKQNIRYINKDLIKDKIDIIVIDVSFISIIKFLVDLLSFVNTNYDIIILIKPQFESEKGEVEKGVIKSKIKHEKIVLKLMDYFRENHFVVKNFTLSPIKGPKGNIEFLVHLTNKGRSISNKLIIDLIRQE